MFSPHPSDPQLLKGLPFEEYRAMDAVNISLLLELDQSPLAFRHRMGTPPGDSDAMRLGRAFHTMVLEPGLFPDQFVVSPFDSWRSKAAREWREEMRESGRDILTADELSQLEQMRKAIRQDKRIRVELCVGTPEVTLVWQDPETGIRCKGRVDLLSSQVLLDLKTTRHIHPAAFSREAARLHYHTKMSWYRWAVEMVTGTAPPVVGLLAVEKDPPHDVALYELDADTLEAGARKWRGLLAQLADCIEHDHWPGAAGGAWQRLVLPEWALLEGDEEMEITIGGEPLAL